MRFIFVMSLVDGSTKPFLRNHRRAYLSLASEASGDMLTMESGTRTHMMAIGPRLDRAFWCKIQDFGFLVFRIARV